MNRWTSRARIVRSLDTLLVFFPLAIVARVLAWPPTLTFLSAFLALIPLGIILGDATGVLATSMGPRAGALLEATLGNAAYLIVLLTLLRAGQIAVVASSLIGTMLVLLLFAVGLGFLLGGLAHGMQRFDGQYVNAASAMLLLALSVLVLPSLFGLARQLQHGMTYAAELRDPALERLSVLLAVVLALVYVLFLVYLFQSSTNPANALRLVDASDAAAREPMWGRRRALAVLAAATIGVAVVGSTLSAAVQPFGRSLGLSPLFTGAILLPLADTMADFIFAVRVGRANLLGLMLTSLLGAVRQIALFLVPVLVIVGALFGPPLTLYFDPFEVLALVLAALLIRMIGSEGTSTWLHGVQLLALYGILAAWLYVL